MAAYTLIRDIPQAGSDEPRFYTGDTHDFSPDVWTSICDALGVTIAELAVPARDGAKAAAERIAALETEVAELRKARSPAPKATGKAKK